jgi:hypothetical protein
LHEAAEQHGRIETGQNPDMSAPQCVGWSDLRTEAFAESFRMTLFEPQRGKTEFTVTITESGRGFRP